ncbi:unnamed protein product, partial [Pylaiella littoralis]
MSASGNVVGTVKRKNLTTSEKRAAIAELLKGSKNGKLGKGDLKRVGEQFQQHPQTISRLWKDYNKQKDAGEVDPNLDNKRKQKSGRKGIDLVVSIQAALAGIPIKNRTTIRIPRSTLFDNLKKLGLRAASRYLKPLLTDGNKTARLEWALRWVSSSAGGGHKFHHFEDFVHIDEKWFYICQNGQKYYLYTDEEVPTRKVQHKSQITKVMFLAAVARPRFDSSRNRNFTGKLGIFPFAEQRVARRNSRNRAAGTLETKCVEVTKEVFKKKVVEAIIPVIKACWPGGRGRAIYIQQDNAPSHRINDDPDVVAACTTDGWNIKLINQPSNSPDTNILDLGFFNSIQSLQDRTTPRTVDELIAEVKRAFHAQTPTILGKVWVSLQAILQEIILAGGDNTFKLPHVKKDRAATSGN